MRSWITALVLACIGLPAAAQTFSNPTGIGVPNIGGVESPIIVSGVTGNISSLSVTLHGVNNPAESDLLFALIAENAKIGLIFWSGTSSVHPINNATLIFNDSATQFLPKLSDDTPIVSGAYRPANRAGIQLVGLTNVTSFSDFNGLNPNDNWALAATDFGAANFGTVNGGWSISFTTGSGAGGVPEPASWAMLIGGFALAGGAIRRKRVQALQAA